MAEENDKATELGIDDVSVLRVLLHNIKGISPVSVTNLEADMADYGVDGE